MKTHVAAAPLAPTRTEPLPDPPAALVTRADAAREELGPLYPFHGRFVRAPRGWLHVVDEGPREAPAVLFLHGNPSWSFLWRAAIGELSARHRVLALDHLGCGLSGPLPGRRYTLLERVEDVNAALAALGVDRCAIVGHDWGGAIALGVARWRRERTSALVLSNTAGFPGIDLPASIRMCRLPMLGPFLLQGANAFLRVALRRCTVTHLSREVRRGYLLPYDSRARRASIRAFVEDIPLSPKDRSYDELLEIERSLPSFAKTKTMLIWGERDFCFHPGFRREFERRLPHAEVVRLEQAGHWWPEDQPEAGVGALADFLGRAQAR